MNMSSFCTPDQGLEGIDSEFISNALDFVLADLDDLQIDLLMIEDEVARERCERMLAAD